MISLILVILSAIADAIGDVIQFHWQPSIFSERGWDAWANPKLSWRRKWKWKNDKLDEIVGERFLGSSTIFVSITDLWHAAKSFQLLTIMLAVVLFQPIIQTEIDWIEILLNFALIRAAYGITFEVFFSRILIKKKLK
jgi:hypothetical protein